MGITALKLSVGFLLYQSIKRNIQKYTTSSHLVPEDLLTHVYLTNCIQEMYTRSIDKPITSNDLSLNNNRFQRLTAYLQIKGSIHKIVFLFLYVKNMLWYSLEAPRRGASNEYPQHMYLWSNMNNIGIFRSKNAANLELCWYYAPEVLFLFRIFQCLLFGRNIVRTMIPATLSRLATVFSEKTNVPQP